jgi:hypothetical protein
VSFQNLLISSAPPNKRSTVVEKKFLGQHVDQFKIVTTNHKHLYQLELCGPVTCIAAGRGEGRNKIKGPKRAEFNTITSKYATFDTCLFSLDNAFRQNKILSTISCIKLRKKFQYIPGNGRDERKAQAMGLPITCNDIINLPMDEFNDLLSKHELTEEQLTLCRDIRRRGKNKVTVKNFLR